MDILTSETFLDQLIHNQRKTIRFYQSFVVGLAILGFVVIALAFLSLVWLPPSFPNISDVFKGLFGLGGSFILGLGGYQYKEVSRGKEKIQSFELIKGEIKNLKDAPKAKQNRVQKQIEEFMWKCVERTALG